MVGGLRVGFGVAWGGVQLRWVSERGVGLFLGLEVLFMKESQDAGYTVAHCKTSHSQTCSTTHG